MTAPRSATVTFVFTDIEGSTRMLQRLGDAAYHEVLESETAIVTDAAVAEGGRDFGSEGDAHFLAFPSAPAALRAAARIQRDLAVYRWPDGVDVRIRIGIHTGDVIVVGDDYAGLAVHHVARVAAVGHGGQVLVSAATAGLVHGATGELGLRDLGVHGLRDFPDGEHLFQLTGPSLEPEFPPLRTVEQAPNNLPTQLTSFVGRAEVNAATELLRNTRLLTLTGPGGTGKTRLSIAVATETMAEFPDGVWFVALASVTDPTLVAPAIATAVGLVVDASRTPLDRVTDYFRTRRALIVLDNFEQVLDAARDVAGLLAAAPALRVIVSSRAPLRISGEQEFPVPPLSLPDAGSHDDPEALARSEAVRLFVDRARAVRPDFALTEANASSVAEIVRRLDGLPLAIELAAARVRILSPQAISTRLADRLGLLIGGGRDLPERQRTLRGAIEWSHDLLEPPQRLLFARLGVFVGTGPLETAEVVCGPSDELGIDVLDGTTSLAEQSLVRVVEDVHADPRFLMLETIREYAAERLGALGETEDLRDRHARAYLALAREMANHLFAADRKIWLDRFEEDHDNFRAALAWRIERGDCEGAADLLAAVWRFWQQRGHVAEGRARATQVLAMTSWPSTPPLARIRALDVAGGLAYWAGDITEAHAHYSEQVAVARAAGDRAELANGLYNLAFAPGPSRNSDEWATMLRQRSIAIAEEAVDIWRELGDEPGIARGLWTVGESSLFIGDAEKANAYYTEALEIFERIGNDFGAAWAYYTRGIGRGVLGELAPAVDDFRAALTRFDRAGDLAGMTFVIMSVAPIYVAAGEAERGHRFGGIGRRLQEDSGANLVALNPSEWFGSLEPDPTDPLLSRAWTDGYAVDRTAAVAEIVGALAAGGTAGAAPLTARAPVAES
ncbi:MAG: ATP-binding protein [Chloroflexota bacterium]